MKFSIQRLWPEILVALLAAAILALPPQLHDLYRALVLEESGYGVTFVGLSEIGDLDSIKRHAEVMILALSILTLVLGTFIGAASFTPGRRVFASLGSWLAGLALALLPAAGALIGLFQSAIPEALIASLRPVLFDYSFAQNLEILLLDDPNQRQARIDANDLAALDVEYLENYGLSLRAIKTWTLASSVLGAALGLAIGWLVYRQQDRWRVRPLHFAALGTAWILIVFTTLYQAPVEGPTLLTPFGLLALFTVALLVGARAFMALFGGWSAHAALGLAAIAATFSYFDLNDNHTIRTVASKQPYLAAIGEKTASPRDQNARRDALPDAEAEFLKWLESRAPRAEAQSEPFPVIIVAAEGGGIYAAFHTATFLSRLTNRCPKFARHLFAISGVSGGSVGAAVFGQDLLQRRRRDEIDFSHCNIEYTGEGQALSSSVEVLSKDHLSPLLSAALFHDMAQFLIPKRVESFDRSKQQEKTLEYWISRRPPKIAEPTSFIESWRPDPEERGVALLLNATDVGTGHRRVFSPFRFKGIGLEFFPSRFVYPAVPEAAITPLSTAAHVSARFPWVSPAAWYKDAQGKHRVVDGGYFENSGVATALDLITHLDTALQRRADAGGEVKPKVVFHVLVLNSDGFDTSRMLGLPEIFEPVRAMLSTRSARSELEIRRLRAFGQAQRLKAAKIRVLEHRLDAKKHPLPLGWKLSTLIRQLIAAQIGLPQSCKAAEKTSGACVQKAMIELLK